MNWVMNWGTMGQLLCDSFSLSVSLSLSLCPDGNNNMMHASPHLPASLPPYLLASLPVFLLTGSILQYAKATILVAKHGSMVRVCHWHCQCQRVISQLPCFISTSSLFDLFDLFDLFYSFHVAEVESRK